MQLKGDDTSVEFQSDEDLDEDSSVGCHDDFEHDSGEEDLLDKDLLDMEQNTKAEDPDHAQNYSISNGAKMRVMPLIEAEAKRRQAGGQRITAPSIYFEIHWWSIEQAKIQKRPADEIFVEYVENQDANVKALETTKKSGDKKVNNNKITERSNAFKPITKRDTKERKLSEEERIKKARFRKQQQERKKDNAVIGKAEQLLQETANEGKEVLQSINDGSEMETN